MCTLLLVISGAAHANPTQTGSTGLINVSTAETLDAGNICIGVWSNYSQNDSLEHKNSLIVPVAITMGVGSFWEIYGTYPNILFNNEEEYSGRGTIDIGTKLRFLGGRDSLFKMAAEFVAQRHVSLNAEIDGITDLTGRLIASYNREKFGVHVTSGYLMPGHMNGVTQHDEVLFGIGAEYMAMPRLKVIAELTGGTGRNAGSNFSLESTAGVQYYLSPHVTINAAAAAGFGKYDPDWRVILGLSSCQGVGSYVRPIPSVGRKYAEKPKEVVKPLKIIPISSMLLKASAQQSSPASKLEVELESAGEDVIIKPYGQISISPQQASSNLTSPVIPVEVPLKARDEEISFQPKQTARDLEASAIEYTMSRVRGVTPLYGVDVRGSQVAIPPATSLPEKMAIYRKFRFPDLTFDFDQWTLTNEGKKMLSDVAEQIRKDKKWLYLKIDGHTDGIGSNDYNMDLSLKRAIAVATYLVSHEGVDASRIFVKGLGKSLSIADNGTADGRRINRRTEVLFLVNKDGQ